MNLFGKTGEGRVVGMGAALVDILIHGTDGFLEKTGAEKGGMIYVENEVIEGLCRDVSSPPKIVPGGSACNTVIGIGRLGGQARFVGKPGADDFGDLFRKGLEENRVEPEFFSTNSPTGKVLSIITPDAQRSMMTFLGAAAETRPEEITPACFADAGIVHIEGYMVFNRDLILAALEAAKSAGALISLDLASYTVVEAEKDFLRNEVCKQVDILMANEDEARVFSDLSGEKEALAYLGKYARMAVLKVGEKGSYLLCDGEATAVEPQKHGEIVDTTGAGDLWASGFLYGLTKGWPPEACGRLASACGMEVCRVVGAHIPEDGWARIQMIRDGLAPGD